MKPNLLYPETPTMFVSSADYEQAREEIEVLRAKLEKCKEQRDFYLRDVFSASAQVVVRRHINMDNDEISSITIDSIKRGK